jgi:hypothetical protein
MLRLVTRSLDPTFGIWSTVTTDASLTGETVDGQAIQNADTITPVGCTN